MSAERFGLEFRPRKHWFRELAAPVPRAADPAAADPAALNTATGYEVVTRRPERPDAAECDRNRSARLRVLRRRAAAAPAPTGPTPTPGGAR